MDEGIAEAVEDDLVQTDRAEAVLRSGDVVGSLLLLLLFVRSFETLLCGASVTHFVFFLQKRIGDVGVRY
jgi:hypothetical protein